MSLDVVSTAASVGTFLVIAATAVAALIQLRHIRSSNELLTLNSAMEIWDSSALQEAVRFVRCELSERMLDPNYRAELDVREPVDRRSHPELYVCDYWDMLGTYVMHGLLRERAFLQMGSDIVAMFWELLTPTIAIMRRKRGRGVFISFEYLAARSRRWVTRYPNGYAPRKWGRLAISDVWLAEDAALLGPDGTSLSQTDLSR